jgi:hypothetical protein
MTDWAQLTHAYGAAHGIPLLLERAALDPASPVWNELWSRLCHQGSVYSASFAALPALTDLARQWSATDRFTPLVLASAILASTDRPYEAKDPRQTYAAEVTELIGLTEQALQDPGPSRDLATYIALLEALLALEGVEVWGQHLHGITYEEYEVPCPLCSAENFVVFGEHGHFTTLESLYMSKSDARRIPLLPKHQHELGPLGRRLHDRALADGHPDLADKLTYVFGSAQCVDCGMLFQVDRAVTAFHDPSATY